MRRLLPRFAAIGTAGVLFVARNKIPYAANVEKEQKPAVVRPAALGNVFRSVVKIVREDGTGTGFVFDEEGAILTNYHVVSGSPTPEFKVVFADGRAYIATLVGDDVAADLAVLRILPWESDERFVAPAFGFAGETPAGSEIAVLGCPLGLDPSVVTGSIASLGKVLSVGGTPKLHGNAYTFPGMSGSPVATLDGRVIGLHNSMRQARSSWDDTPDRSGVQPGILAAIPIEFALPIARALLRPRADGAEGGVSRPWVGATVATVDRVEQEALLSRAGRRAPASAKWGGVLVLHVEPGSPAAKAGLQAMDLLLECNGTPLRCHLDWALCMGPVWEQEQSYRVVVARLLWRKTALDEMRLVLHGRRPGQHDARGASTTLGARAFRRVLRTARMQATKENERTRGGDAEQHEVEDEEENTMWTVDIVPEPRKRKP